MERGAALNNTSLTALGGIISALSVFMMFLSGVFPFLTYVIPAFSGLLLIVTVREADLKWSFFIYCAVAILSMLVVADKEAAVMYTFFFGYYPVVREFLERHSSGVLKVIAKFAIFNVSVVLGYLVIIYVFAIPIEEMEEFGKYTYLVLLGLGNIIFVLVDNIISNLTYIYDKRWHKRIAKIFGIKK